MMAFEGFAFLPQTHSAVYQFLTYHWWPSGEASSLFLFFFTLCSLCRHIVESNHQVRSTRCSSMMEFDNIPLDTECKVENGILSSSLLDEITCAICLDIFEEPKRTSCLHVACRRCLEEYHHSCKNEMDIATCRSLSLRGSSDSNMNAL